MLPASLDWLGWTGLALAVLAFIFMFIKRQLKKPDERSHHIILLNLFPVVHIPREIPRAEAEKITHKLRDTYIITWAKLSDVYSTFPLPLPVATIGTTMNKISSAHPHIVWYVPTDKCFLRVQKDMYLWFALELHNMFRYNLYGVKGIYEKQGLNDGKNANIADEWIRGRFSEDS